MKKLTLKDLQSLAHELPVVSEKEQRVYVGGGTGSNLNPFSEENTVRCWVTVLGKAVL